jgi:hypothetical protein
MSSVFTVFLFLFQDWMLVWSRIAVLTFLFSHARSSSSACMKRVLRLSHPTGPSHPWFLSPVRNSLGLRNWHFACVAHSNPFVFRRQSRSFALGVLSAEWIKKRDCSWSCADADQSVSDIMTIWML